jgi:hypothetical protein
VGSALVRVAAATGVVYMLVGLGGFLATEGHHASAHVGHVLMFQVNPLHNLAHLALGGLLLTGAARGAEAARQATIPVGLVYLFLGLLGPLIAGTPANVVAVNGADHVLHMLTAAALLAAGVVMGRRMQPTS